MCFTGYLTIISRFWFTNTKENKKKYFTGEYE